MAGSIEESAKANVALVAVFPVMVIAMLTIIMLQVRSFSTMTMVMLTAPLGLVGAVPVLLHVRGASKEPPAAIAAPRSATVTHADHAYPCG